MPRATKNIGYRAGMFGAMQSPIGNTNVGWDPLLREQREPWCPWLPVAPCGSLVAPKTNGNLGSHKGAKGSHKSDHSSHPY